MASADASGYGTNNPKSVLNAAASSLTTKQIIDIYETSIKELRDYLLPIVGGTAMEAIIRNAVRANKSEFPFLANLSVGMTEISLEPLKSEAISPADLLRAIFEFMQSIIELLTELTGDILAQKAKALASEIANRLGEDHHD